MLKTFKAVIETLKQIVSEDIDKKIRDAAKGFLKNLNKFDFVLIIHLMNKIFLVTTPLAAYTSMQAPGIDFIQAMKLIMATKKQFQELRDDKLYGIIFSDST